MKFFMKTLQEELIPDFRKARIIVWDIAKYKTNILIHLQKYESQRTITM